ncbi:hypothetical protein ACO22_01432 [Paracoccidioides brasiliensis]|uniref:Uncharacterized protein n=1 Tax=Paracoccidioides brasiliensis TaxID=121759 RepID=A0A1D2JLJ6_PARBR|nr:hypothetical protein ACO22_01432 [Paracoccidioides brasiliensis]
MEGSPTSILEGHDSQMASGGSPIPRAEEAFLRFITSARRHELSWRPAPRNRSGHLRFKRGPEADQTDVNTDELLRVFEEDSDVTGSAFFDEDDVSWTMKENPVSQTTASQMPPTYSSLRLIPNISLTPA